MNWTPLRTWAAGAGMCVLAVGVVGGFIEEPQPQVTLASPSGAVQTLATADPVATVTATSTTDPGPSVTSPAPTTTSPAPTTTSPAPTTIGPAPAPVIVVKKVVVTQRIPFSKRVVKDKTLLKGKTKVVTKGRSGYRARIYQYTYRDGVVVKRTLISIKVTRKPVAQVVHVGTKVKGTSGGDCDPNYSGCVPIASDVDCAGGSGNGPEYVSGPVKVIGDDIYDLDRDNDGTACE